MRVRFEEELELGTSLPWRLGYSLMEGTYF
jgi:hypothetical protein